MTRASGKTIRFHDETDEEAFASRAGFGAPEYEVRGWVSSYWAIRDGSLSRVSTDVRTLTGARAGLACRLPSRRRSAALTTSRCRSAALAVEAR